MNKFSTGINFAYDKYEEFVNRFDHSRTDNSIGAFFEYTYDNTSNFSIILGGRLDNHNRIGAFFTPRLHVRYNPWEKGVIRFSAGRGIRSANIFAENQQLFGSSRYFLTKMEISDLISIGLILKTKWWWIYIKDRNKWFFII